MAQADGEQLEVAVLATVHVPEGASIRTWRRPGESITVFSFGDERFALEVDDAMVPTFARALAELPADQETLTWDGTTATPQGRPRCCLDGP